MKQIKLVLCLFILIFAFTSVAQAQEKLTEGPAIELETTVVTATKSPREVKRVCLQAQV